MIDHVKTLLLNESPGIVSPLAALPVGPLPDIYRQKTLAGPVLAAYTAVFGTGCDIAGKLLRIGTLLPLLHQPDLEALTVGRDSRVSYTPSDMSFISIGLDQPVTEPDVMVMKPSAGNPLYRCYYDVTFSRNDSSHVTVYQPGLATTVEVTVANGYTPFIAMTNGFSCAIPDIANGSTRHFTVCRPLRDNLGTVYDRISKTDNTAALFSGYDEAAELLRIFTGSPERMKRLGAYCLALAFSVEAA